MHVSWFVNSVPLIYIQRMTESSRSQARRRMAETLQSDREKLMKDSQQAVIDVAKEKGSILERMKKMQTLAQIAETFSKRFFFPNYRKK